jgi:cytochrome c
MHKSMAELRSASIGAALAIVWMSAASYASPFSDQFSGTTLNPGWTIVTPNPASTVQLTGSGDLQIVASPLNGGSDLFAGTNYNGPVILQPVDPSLNWTIETEINFDPTNNYQGAGILLATTTSPFTSASQFYRIAERAFYPNGGGNVVEGAGGGSLLYSGTMTYLEVTKLGDLYTTSYSSDGSSWTEIGSGIYSTSYPEIGLFTLRQPWDGDTSLSSTADFNFFDITVNSAVPETSTWAMMFFGFVGLGLAGFRRARIAASAA